MRKTEMSVEERFCTLRYILMNPAEGKVSTISWRDGEPEFTPKVPYRNKDGYCFYNFYDEGKQYTVYEHRAMWYCSRDSLPRFMEVHHMDFDPTNNMINNLDLVTREYNIALSKLERERWAKLIEAGDFQKMKRQLDSGLDFSYLSKRYGVSVGYLKRYRAKGLVSIF